MFLRMAVGSRLRRETLPGSALGAPDGHPQPVPVTCGMAGTASGGSPDETGLAWCHCLARIGGLSSSGGDESLREMAGPGYDDYEWSRASYIQLQQVLGIAGKPERRTATDK